MKNLKNIKKLLKSLSGFIVLIIIIILALLYIGAHNFNEKVFDADNAYKITEELSSAEYGGRLSGSEGNTKALQYVENYFRKIGLSPAGENGGYYQDLSVMLPVYKSVPEFSVRDKNGNVVRSFRYGEDFREVLNGSGGSGAVDEKLYLYDADKNINIKGVPVDTLKGSIILAKIPLSDNDMQYAIDKGCRAVIYPESDVSRRESFDIHSKSGKTTIIYIISQDTFDALSNYMAQGMKVYMKLDVEFKMTNTPNILGKIEGTNKNAGYIIISSHIDGAGSLASGEPVPGSLHDASGTAMVMELARDIKAQKSRPEKTIIFAVWNSFEENLSGSTYYAEHPLYPLDKSQVFVLDTIGSAVSKDLNISSAGSQGKALMNKLNSYFGDNQVNPINTTDSTSPVNALMLDDNGKNDSGAFISKNVPAVLICGVAGPDIPGSTDDNMKNVNKERMAYTGSTIISYIHREVYGDLFHGLLTVREEVFFSILIMIMLLIYLIKSLYKLMPRGKLGKIKLEDIYYSTAFGIADKVSQMVLIVVLAAFIIAFLIYIPKDFDVIWYNGSYMTNSSIYMIAHNAAGYIRDLLVHGLGRTDEGFNVTYVISFSVMKSVILILCSVLLAFTAGTLLGVLSGFRQKVGGSTGGSTGEGTKGSSAFLGSIAVMSLPDVLIAILIQLICAFLYQHNILSPSQDGNTAFIFPFICLAIIPMAYISRIAQIAVREELNKDYIMAAKAKGLSNFSILKNHLLISVVIKVVEALPSVLNIIISNLIIVEYLFSYPGIVYQLFSYLKEYDIKTCIGLIIGIGMVYCILIFIFKIAALIINPFKRRSTAKSTQNN